jgi:hypothetical protein
MPKTVFRSTVKLVRESLSTPFFPSTPSMENAKLEFKSQGKVLNYFSEHSADEFTRIYQIDFKDEESRILWRQEPSVEQGMKEFFIYNSNNNIVTYITEELINTNDYD